MAESYYIRDASEDDFDEISKFVRNDQTHVIGPQRRKHLNRSTFFRHFATYRLVAFVSEQSTNIVAYGEFRNYPYLYALPGRHWLDFLNTHYTSGLNLPLSVTNTLFFNYCTVAIDHIPHVLQSFLREVFFREDQLKFIMTIEPPECTEYRDPEKKKEIERANYYMLEEVAEKYFPRVFCIETCKNTQRLHVARRTDLLDKMSYRQALPEDNDDIIEVIDVDRPDLREGLGDFFISEELLRPGIQHNRLIVTEVLHLTAGFVWLNDDIDVLTLMENYEVDMFANIIKYNPKQRVKALTLTVVAIEKKPPEDLFTKEALTDIYEMEYIEKCLLPERLSSMSVNSSSNIRIKSIYGTIETTNDRYLKREDYLEKINKISYHLQSPVHYLLRFEKNVDLVFNVPEKYVSKKGEFDIPSTCANLFALQLFGMHRNNDVRRLFRLILAAFTSFPKRDYCIFSIPEGAAMSQNIQFILKYFVLIPQRPCCTLTDALYIIHRSSIFGEITLHAVRTDDVPDINGILLSKDFNDEGWSSQSSDIDNVASSSESFDGVEVNIVNDILDEVFNNPYSEFIFKTIRCGRSDEPPEKNVLVGFIIIRPMNLLHLFTPNFSMPRKPFHDVHTAEIVTLRLQPFYHHQYGVIFRELARLTHFFEFYYTQSLMQDSVFFPNDLVLFMQPMEPRPYKKISKAGPQYDPADIVPDQSNFFQRLNYVNDNFALYWHNLNNIQFSGTERELVILGFSPVCKAFLRTLIFNWKIPGAIIPNESSHVPRLNITVLTPPGIIEAEYDKDVICWRCKEKGERCYLDSCNWNDFIGDVTRRMDIRQYIRFITGYVQSIDRETQQIHLQNKCIIAYKELLLFNDISFGPPKRLYHPESLPSNYIDINSRFDRLMAFHKVDYLRRFLSLVNKKTILIYGAHLRTFEFIHFLLEHEIPAEWIQLVTPYQKSIREAESVFNLAHADERVELILQDMIIGLGVKLFLNQKFTNWSCYEDDGNITEVEFVNSNGVELNICCDLFVSFYETYNRSDFIDILHESGITMNGRNIIVNADFRTNDPSIYALGTYIQHEEEPNHQYRFVSPKEAAEKLIYKLGLIPEQLESPFEAKFLQPHSCEVNLPIGYRMFKAVMPKRYLVNHLDNEYTRSLVTNDGAFCRVRLNPFDVVEEIVVITTKKISFQFLLHFIGRNDLLLNNLRARFCNEEISSFLDYFQEPWTELIIHDKFGELQAQNRKLLMSAVDKKCTNLNIERNKRRAEFRARAQKKDLNKRVEDGFIKFLRDHRRDIKHPFALPEDFFTTRNALH